MRLNVTAFSTKGVLTQPFHAVTLYYLSLVAFVRLRCPLPNIIVPNDLVAYSCSIVGGGTSNLRALALYAPWSPTWLRIMNKVMEL